MSEVGSGGLGVGDTLGPYRLESWLGEGAVGTVFGAAREHDSRTVAVKVLKRRLSASPFYVQRFRREARIADEVRHRHLVPVVDSGEAAGRLYLATTYVAGGSLADRLVGHEPLSIRETVSIAAEIAGGLDALHRHGLVHRDVKPSNIMLGDAGAALTDFGLAKGPAYTVLTSPGQVLGTLDYLAPELIEGRDASAASDLYALGCVVFACLAGSPPFADRDVMRVGWAHLEEAPPTLAGRRTDVSPELDWATGRALAKEPLQRPATATAYAHLLRTAAARRR